MNVCSVMMNENMKIFLSGEELRRLSTTSERSLPKRGSKNEFPIDSNVESEDLGRLLEERRTFLSEEKVGRQNCLLRGEWIPNKAFVLITKNVGKHFLHMGRTIDGQNVLFPEEALFLMDINCMEVYSNEMPLSMQEAYEILLTSNLALEKYQVYAHLSRLGYIVVRHQGRISRSRLKSNEVPSTSSKRVFEVCDESRKKQHCDSLTSHTDVYEACLLVRHPECSIPCVYGKDVIRFSQLERRFLPQNVLISDKSCSVDLQKCVSKSLRDLARNAGAKSRIRDSRWHARREIDPFQMSRNPFQNYEQRNIERGLWFTSVAGRSSSGGFSNHNFERRFRESDSSARYAEENHRSGSSVAGRGSVRSFFYYNAERGFRESDTSARYAEENRRSVSSGNFRGYFRSSSHFNFERRFQESDTSVRNIEENYRSGSLVAGRGSASSSVRSNFANASRESDAAHSIREDGVGRSWYLKDTDSCSCWNDSKDDGARSSNRDDLRGNVDYEGVSKSIDRDSSLERTWRAQSMVLTSAKCWKQYKEEFRPAVCLKLPIYEQLSTQKIKPLLGIADVDNTASILKKLSIIEQIGYVHFSPTSESKLLNISFDVYLPNSGYKKTVPSLPDHRLVVVRVEDEIPKVDLIAGTVNNLADDVSLHFAVVENGDVAFYSLDDVFLPTMVSMG